MTADVPPADFAARFYVEPAAAYARHTLALGPDLPTASVIDAAMRAGLRLHSFKRTADLPRVRRVLGILRGLAPESVLDVGSGRGLFLWPLLDAFPDLTVTAIDRSEERVARLRAVAAGGISRLRPMVADIHNLDLPDSSVDVVTFLEVLEHLQRPALALAHAMRVARRCVVLSVPSKPDDNPEHLHLFTRDELHGLLLDARAVRVSFDGVLNHLIAVARR